MAAVLDYTNSVMVTAYIVIVVNKDHRQGHYLLSVINIEQVPEQVPEQVSCPLK